MKFSIQDGSSIEGVLTYDESEYGFSFSAQNGEALSERLGSEGVTSLLIGTLQLEVDIESRGCSSHGGTSRTFEVPCPS